MAELQFDPQSGVIVPSTREVREDLAASIQQALKTGNAAEVNTDSTSPLGQIIDLIAAGVQAKNSDIAFLANQSNPQTASGIFLDAVIGLYGMKRKTSEPTVVVCTCRGLKGTKIPYGVLVADGNGNQLRHAAALGAIIGDSGTCETRFETVEHGPVEIGPGTVTQIVTVIPGWDSVTNAAAGVQGRDVETDADLLSRFLASYSINAHGTVDAIRANLAELEGVLDCVVLENYTNEKQTQYAVELKPHSIAVCIVGGDDSEIARTIFELKSAGCGTTGNTEVSHVDHDHYDAEYVYSIVRPSAVPFSVKVTFFAKDMDEDTKAAVRNAVEQDFLGALTNPRVTLATTVYASRFYRCIQAVTSAPVKSVQIGINDGPLSDSIEIPATQSPTISDDRIELAFEGGS